MSKLDKFLALPEDDEEESSDPSTGSEQEEEETKPQLVKKKVIQLSVEDLENAGYRSGPSVLYVKPPAETGEPDWNWGKGGSRSQKEEEEDDGEDRAATRGAMEGLEQSAAIAVKAMEHAARLREGMRQERMEAKQQERMGKEKPLSFNQKEKRKRDEGKTSRAKSTVEESKRQARELGIYSGFD